MFVAGATGATGQVFVPMATERGLELVVHVRPQSKDKTPLGTDPRARIFDLGDLAALTPLPSRGRRDRVVRGRHDAGALRGG